MKLDKLTVVVALIAAVLTITSPRFAPREIGVMAMVDGNTDMAFFAAWTLVSIPLAFAMPRLRARFFGSGWWRVPSSTYILPQWIVRLCIGLVLGQAAGYLFLGVAADSRCLWPAASFAIIGAAFLAGAWGRLKKHPRTEFAMRWWGCY